MKGGPCGRGRGGVDKRGAGLYNRREKQAQRKGRGQRDEKQAGKRIFAALLVLTLSACGGGEKTPETPGRTDLPAIGAQRQARA